MEKYDFFIGENHQKNLLNIKDYESITLSFDSGGSGGGAYFMGFVEELSKHPKFIKRLSLVTGISAGGFASLLLSTKKTDLGFSFWLRVCSPTLVLRHLSIQKNIEWETKKLLKDVKHFTLPLKIHTKLMPSTDPGSELPSWQDRLSSRFGFKIKEFILWSIGQDTSIERLSFDSRRLDSDQNHDDLKRLLSKILVGGARFVPFFMGPTIKISDQEAKIIERRKGGIIHDFGMISLIGGLEAIVDEFESKKTLHIVVVGQNTEEFFWNHLRRQKIKRLLKNASNNVLLVPALWSLPKGAFGLPNWLSFNIKVLRHSYIIGKKTARKFLSDIGELN